MRYYLMTRSVREYDTYGQVGSEEVFRGSEANFDEIFKDIGIGGFKDIFEQVFGGREGGFADPFNFGFRFDEGREAGGFADPFNFGFRFGGGGRRRGQDLVYDAELSLEDVLKGKERKSNYQN